MLWFILINNILLNILCVWILQKAILFQKISKQMIMTVNVLEQDRNTHKVTKNAYSHQKIYAKREQREKNTRQWFSHYLESTPNFFRHTQKTALTKEKERKKEAITTHF